jgi:hypothetical protein
LLNNSDIGLFSLNILWRRSSVDPTTRCRTAAFHHPFRTPERTLENAS